jgi:endogenous inhibitor of DNA gyrase (YacG/DUF329 family)
MTSSSDKRSDEAAGGRAQCPICGKPRVAGHAPFCSRRCADVDLHRWLTEGYAIPAVDDDAESAEEGDDE